MQNEILSTTKQQIAVEFEKIKQSIARLNAIVEESYGEPGADGLVPVVEGGLGIIDKLQEGVYIYEDHYTKQS